LVRAVERELRALDEGREAVWRRLQEKSVGEKGVEQEGDGGEYWYLLESLDLEY
jgi:hypothetical protein